MSKHLFVLTGHAVFYLTVQMIREFFKIDYQLIFYFSLCRVSKRKVALYLEVKGVGIVCSKKSHLMVLWRP